MRSSSSKIIIIVFLIVGVLMDVLVGVLSYTSDNYAPGEWFRVVNCMNLIFLILTILIIFIRHNRRRNKFFKLTRSNEKEPESQELLEFKEIQYRLWQTAIIFFVITIILSVLEMI